MIFYMMVIYNNLSQLVNMNREALILYLAASTRESVDIFSSSGFLHKVTNGVEAIGDVTRVYAMVVMDGQP